MLNSKDFDLWADEQKVTLLRELLSLLNENGRIFIGDVAFETREKLEQCKVQAGDEWDEDEIYFVAEELKEYFPEMQFKEISYCAGVLCL